MELQSGKLYWHETIQASPVFPTLNEDIECDVLIIGGGSSGAQLAYLLKDSHLDVVLVDKRKVGNGSTMANTSLIQYMGDKTVTEMVDTLGETYAIRHFKLCEQAIKDIEKICEDLPLNPDYIKRDSLYYVSCEEDEGKVRSDYDYLKRHGFKVDWLTEEEIGKRYPFKKRSAMMTYDEGEMNPVKYVYGLLESAKEKVRIFEETEVLGKRIDKEGVTVDVKSGNTIRCKKLVIAGGYETLEFKRDNNAVLESSYAVVTTPVADFSDWYGRTLIWESARPYIYMRTTADNRIIIGGLDDSTSDPEKRNHKILYKKDKLIEEFNELFPSIKVEAEYYLGAYYGVTRDGLPMIGEYEESPHCYFMYGYGDNGTVYNMVLGKIVADILTAGTSGDLELYLQTRPLRMNV